MLKFSVNSIRRWILAFAFGIISVVLNVQHFLMLSFLSLLKVIRRDIQLSFCFNQVSNKSSHVLYLNCFWDYSLKTSSEHSMNASTHAMWIFSYQIKSCLKSIKGYCDQIFINQTELGYLLNRRHNTVRHCR